MCARIFCQPAVTTGIVTMCRRIVTESLSTEPVDNFVNNFGTRRCNAPCQAGTPKLDNCYTHEQMTNNQRVTAVMRKTTSQNRLNSLFPHQPASHVHNMKETARSEEHTSELQSRGQHVCRLL